MNRSLHPDQRLPKKEIMRKRNDFQDVFQNGKRCEEKHLRFFFKEADRRQIGFAVPKRIGKAVVRNRIKRLMREVYRKHRQEIGSYTIVILAKYEIVGARLQDMENEFEQFLKKTELTT